MQLSLNDELPPEIPIIDPSTVSMLISDPGIFLTISVRYLESSTVLPVSDTLSILSTLLFSSVLMEIFESEDISIIDSSCTSR